MDVVGQVGRPHRVLGEPDAHILSVIPPVLQMHQLRPLFGSGCPQKGCNPTHQSSSIPYSEKILQHLDTCWHDPVLPQSASRTILPRWFDACGCDVVADGHPNSLLQNDWLATPTHFCKHEEQPSTPSQWNSSSTLSHALPPLCCHNPYPPVTGTQN